MNLADVVLVDWPYSDITGSKLRPAVVVQADFLNGLIEELPGPIPPESPWHKSSTRFPAGPTVCVLVSEWLSRKRE